MSQKKFAVAALLLSCTWTQTGHIAETPCARFGMRPASDGPGNYAVTLQVRTDWPAHCVSDGGALNGR